MKERNGGREGESGRKREYEDGGKRASVGSFPSYSHSNRGISFPYLCKCIDTRLFTYFICVFTFLNKFKYVSTYDICLMRLNE